jgi:hypothetical protein
MEEGNATVMGKVRVQTQCPRCRRQEVTEYPLEGYQAWKAGQLLQDAMPTVSAENREKLITGFCSPCWDRMFRGG